MDLQKLNKKHDKKQNKQTNNDNKNILENYMVIVYYFRIVNCSTRKAHKNIAGRITIYENLYEKLWCKTIQIVENKNKKSINQSLNSH